MSQETNLAKNQFEKMTTKPVGRLLISLSIPTILSMMVTNIYNIVDTAFVGTLGTSESGATGVVLGFMTILQAFGFLCGQGAGSLMSRKLGQKDLEEATRYTSTGFFLSFSFGIVLAYLATLFLPGLLRMLGSTDTIEGHAGVYISYMILAAPFFTSSFTMNNLLRYEGKAKLGTVGMMTGAVLNIIGDAVLMFGFKMGIAGAGISTAVSQFISFCILRFMFLGKKTQTKIALRYFAKDISMVFRVITTGFPSLLRQGLNSIACMILNQKAGLYGDEAVAAMSIVSRISFFPMSVAIGIGQGFQPISSFNYGAGKGVRVKEAFWRALFGAEVVLILFSLPIFVFAGPVIQRMRDDIEVVELGVRALRLMCLAQLLVPLTMMVEMGFQSTGARLLASFASSLRSGLLFIPAILLFEKYRGMAGIQEAQPFSFVMTFFICIFLCRLFMKRLSKEPKKHVIKT